MKHHPILCGSVCFTLFALVSGCSTTNLTDVTNVAPVSTGQIVGWVQLQEMDCSTSASPAGVNVALMGTSIKAVSDTTGTFTLDSVPAGYYALDYTKPGFQEFIESPVVFVGAGTAHGFGTVLGRIKNWKTSLGWPAVTQAYYPIPDDTQFTIGFRSDSSTFVDSSG